MLLYMGNYIEAYQYLGKAMQMPGGDKYKASWETTRKYLQNAMKIKQGFPIMFDANPAPYRLPFSKPALGEPDRRPFGKAPPDDDDD